MLFSFILISNNESSHCARFFLCKGEKLMVYQAFYRVYRPQTFRDMSGQTHVKRTLQNALLANKTTHAYLFSGPRGTGKTSAAKIFAKALNCENAPAEEPCNKCQTCISITEGTFTDVIEFDAASNSRVEEIRDVIENVRFAPALGRFKVYIIDEVHMLSTSAFNALLKTLEEPPAHVVFILATTEPHKLPATIISRCQRFDFKRLTSQEMIDRMSVVLNDINLAYDEQALKVIAQSAAGGMRDALSLLDQAVSFSEDKLELENTLLVTGAISQDIFTQMAAYIQQKDVAKMLTLLEQLVADGKDPLRLTEDFITFFRDLLLLQSDDKLEELLEVTTLTDEVHAIAERFTAGNLYHYIEVLSKTQQEMRFSHHTKIYLETALLQMVQAQPTIDPEVNAKVAQLEQMISKLTTQLQQAPEPTQVQAPQLVRPQRGPEVAYKPPITKIKQVLKDATKENLNFVKQNMASALSTLQKAEEARFHKTMPVAASPSAFVLKFEYDVLCKMVAENTAILQSVASQLAYNGQVPAILCIPEAQWEKVRADFLRERSVVKEEQTTEEVVAIVEEDPLVVMPKQLFGDNFVEIFED